LATGQERLRSRDIIIDLGSIPNWGCNQSMELLGSRASMALRISGVLSDGLPSADDNAVPHQEILDLLLINFSDPGVEVHLFP
jgi:hypothetical protein